MKKIPYAIVIMDGYGLGKANNGNAIFLDGSKNVAELEKTYPTAQLGASGLSVGLPDGQMGNSEVGHLNIGAGRIVYQDLTKITKSIQDGDFFTNPALCAAMDNAVKNGKKLHLWGLLSDGGVHSHITHLFALLEMAKRRGVPQTYGEETRRAAGVRPRFHGRQRRLPHLGRSFRERTAGGDEQARIRQDRFPLRQILRDGPRQ